jgi:hypothetical protein
MCPWTAADMANVAVVCQAVSTLRRVPMPHDAPERGGMLMSIPCPD